jgi:predicted transcriptional regulator of viral defense system
MKFTEFLELFGHQPYFNLSTVVQLTAESRQTVCTQLYRWTKEGKLLSLRRGMYAFSEPYQRHLVNPAALSNHLYKPSYLSTYWALSYYGMIPEKVPVFTAVSTRVTRKFSNSFGLFRYSNIKTSLFFGYRAVVMDEQKVLLADPEKALLDLWHLEQGEWHQDRVIAMRYQNLELVNTQCLADYAARFNSPRIDRAVEQWNLLGSDEEGTIEL